MPGQAQPFATIAAFQLLSGRQHVVLAAADLRLQDLALRADDESELPSELVRQQYAPGLTAVFVKDEQLADFDGRA